MEAHAIRWKVRNPKPTTVTGTTAASSVFLRFRIFQIDLLILLQHVSLRFGLVANEFGWPVEEGGRICRATCHMPAHTIHRQHQQKPPRFKVGDGERVRA